MANIKSSKKSALQDEARRKKNLARKTAIKTAIKKVLLAVKDGSENVSELLNNVAAQLGRARGKHLIHRNTAARKLSRLAKKVAAVKKEQQA